MFHVIYTLHEITFRDLLQIYGLQSQETAFRHIQLCMSIFNQHQFFSLLQCEI